MSAEKLAPCGFGAFGTCCCTCINLVKTLDKCDHLGGSRKCSTEDGAGWACLGFYNTDGGPIELNHSQHGMCEMYQSKEKQMGNKDVKKEVKKPKKSKNVKKKDARDKRSK